MRLILSSARGLLSGWFIALTLPLLVDPHTISAWSAAGLVLLIVSFVGAGVVHLHHGELPWWLAAYSLIATFLWRLTVRAGQMGAPASGGSAPG